MVIVSINTAVTKWNYQYKQTHILLNKQTSLETKEHLKRNRK